MSSGPRVTKKLGQIAVFVDYRGKTPIKTSSGVPLLTAKNVRQGRLSIEPREYIAESNYAAWMTRGIPQVGDVLITTEAPLGNVVCIDWTHKFALAQRVICLQPNPVVLFGPFLATVLQAPDFQEQLAGRSTGTTVAGIKASRLKELEVPVPPLNEQRRIVTKLEALQSRSRRAREALDAVPPLLEKLRQSILAAAFRGDLTKDWRAQNPNPEPAPGLVARIRTERRKKWEAVELARLKAKGKSPTNDGWKEKYREPEAVDAAELPELPEGWCWASVNELLAEGLANGRSVLTDDTGFPVLRLTALKHGRLDLSERKGGAWSVEDAAPFLVRRNDFLVSRGNGSLALVGRGGLVDAEPDAVAFPDTLIRIRVHELVSHEYLSRVWNASLVRRQIERAAKTTAGIFKVSQGDLEKILIPVPSRSEQARICSILDESLGSVRRLEVVADSTAVEIGTFERAILAKAVRGELVNQDSNDEPADVMLSRFCGAQSVDASARRKGRAKAAE